MKTRMHGRDVRDAMREMGGPFRSCLTKRAYNSEKGALMAIHFNPELCGIRAYHCQNCGKWHTTKAELFKESE